jgi:hypothetical protein
MAFTTKKLSAAFDEIKANPPAILAKTRAKSGPARANAQRIAIAFSKAGEKPMKQRTLRDAMTREKA